jgi:uncharacterized protein (TIGR03435 family)
MFYMYSLRALTALLIFLAQDVKGPQFEVASIKPAALDARGMFIRPSPGGRVSVTNMTLKELIVIAYRIQPYQISGGPVWLGSARYDISAKAENTLKDRDLQPMLQALLADRFQLTIHRETKELPIYALVLARKDGKLGPKLIEAQEGGCTVPDFTKPPAPPEPGKPPVKNCGQQMMSPRSLTAYSVPIANIVPMLARMLGRTVIDKTGLTGKYDISAEWAPDESLMLPLSPDAPRPASDGSGPSIFTALQEQLGLKMESQKGPVEVFVVERAEKPSEN